MSSGLPWRGVWPAITTPFDENGNVDYEALQSHVNWMIESGCHGIIPLGSLGEGATLTFEEKLDVLRSVVEAAVDTPVCPGIAALSTGEAANLAVRARQIGCRALMVLPPYVYSTDWREMKAHVSTVIRESELPCMLYNNPIAYKTDFVPEQVAELCGELESLEAMKESSADVRRVTELKRLLDGRLSIMMGVDDVLVEGMAAGAIGWVAGLVNAFPVESVRLWKLCLDGRWEDARALYEWFLPLLRLDTVPKFVQLIKLIQAQVGRGTETVRPPRLHLVGTEREEALQVIRHAMASLPVVGA